MLACRKKINAKNKKFLGFKNKMSSRSFSKNPGWRFVFGILATFSIFSFFLPWDVLITSIKAINGKTEIINLYAHEVLIENENDDYSQGWWNAEKALGDPNLAPNASFFDYSDHNSAFLNQGRGELLISGFRFLEGELLLLERQETDFENDIEKNSEEINILESESGLSDEVSEFPDKQDGGNEELITENSEENIIEDGEEAGTVDIEAEISEEGEFDLENGNAGAELQTEEIFENDNKAPDLNLGIEIEVSEKGSDSDMVEIKDNMDGATNDVYIFETKESIQIVEITESETLEATERLAPNTGAVNPETQEPVSAPEMESAAESAFLPRNLKNYLFAASAQAAENLKNNLESLSALGDFTRARINFSLAVNIKPKENESPEAQNISEPETAQAGVTIWYALDSGDEDADLAEGDGRIWHKLESINYEKILAKGNGAYYDFEAPFLNSWEDVERLHLKIEAYDSASENILVYLDSAWVEAEFEPSEQVRKIKTRQNWQSALELVSKQTDFKAENSGEFRFRFNKKKVGLLSGLSELFFERGFWQGIDIRAVVLDFYGREIDSPLSMIFEEDGEFSVKLDNKGRRLKPGRYTLKFIIEDSTGKEAEVFEILQDFNWGVLALNMDKSVYSDKDESAYLQMGVLDSRGHTICDAKLLAIIESPEGIISELSTDNGLVVRNDKCDGDTVIEDPDYFSHYMLYGIGEYKISLFATTSGGAYSIRDKFFVQENLAFDVSRTGPTRIYPKAEYDMTIGVKANEDFQGSITEMVPAGFAVMNNELRIMNYGSDEFSIIHNSSFIIQAGESTRELIWQDIDLKKGDKLEIAYTFDAPDDSPEFYLLGPAELSGYGTSSSFIESRYWQIASDAPVVATSTNGTNVNWIDPSNAWDNGVNTYARRLVPRKTGGGEPANYIQSSVNSALDLGGVINTVEIGIEGYVANTAVTAYLVPYFNGSTAGSVRSITGATIGTTDDNVTDYVTITDDTNGPRTGNWTWDDIMNLDIRVYGGNTSNSADYNFFIDQIRIRVDYTPNTPPEAYFLSAKQRVDNSGVVDISIRVSDGDNDPSRARLDYVLGADCNFSSPLDPTLDESNESATSTILDVDIDNNSVYQIGTTTNLIRTTAANDVHFDWLSKTDIPQADGTYCLRITANDFDDDDPTPATTTLIIDNKAPSAPGAFVSASTTKNSAILFFGATSSDSHFSEYRIFYGTSTPLSENDFLFASTSDVNLLDVNFNSAATTTIGGLLENTTYYFSLFAYDEYGHVSSSSPAAFTTNRAPLGVFSASAPPAQRSDGSGVVDISIEIDDYNNDFSRAKIEYAAGSDCVFSPAFDPELDETPGSISSTYGVVRIENDNPYQIGLPDYWIQTPATNTIAFDWLGKNDLPDGDGQYCLRLTANDFKDDQNISATALVTIDNSAPTAPGNLSMADVGTSTITLNFGATTTESNFAYYRIFYKAGTSGVTEANTPHLDANLNNILYNGAETTLISGLNSNTDYVFNIWAYDSFGNKASASEITLKTNATVYNNFLLFLNPVAGNIAVAGEGDEWTFRAEVTEETGWEALDRVVLRLADGIDAESPYGNLEFSWTQASNSFTETGIDANSAVSLSASSAANCAGIICTVDFNLVFNHNFTASSTNYSAELYSVNDSALSDFSIYPDLYQVKIVTVKQIHYRWRNDDGGE